MAYATTRHGRPVEIIGHRGSPREYRENTLPSFARAFAAGAHAVELDVHATRDCVVVIHHDSITNSRPGDTGVRADIAESPFEVLRTIPVGDGPMPKLEELLAAIPDDGIAYIEVKGKNIEEQVVSVIHSSRARCAVHSFDHRIAQRVHEIAPDLPVGILQTSYPIDPVRPMREAGARDLWQHWELIDRALIDRVHDDGRRVIAWTVNDAAIARRLVSWTIDGICSDVPGDMRALIDELVR